MARTKFGDSQAKAKSLDRNARNPLVTVEVSLEGARGAGHSPRPLARPHTGPAGRHHRPNHALHALDGTDTRSTAPDPASPPKNALRPQQPPSYGPPSRPPHTTPSQKPLLALPRP